MWLSSHLTFHLIISDNAMWKRLQNVWSQINQIRLKPLSQPIWQPPPLHPVSYQPTTHRRLLPFPEDSFVMTSRQFGIHSWLQFTFHRLVHGIFLEIIILFSSCFPTSTSTMFLILSLSPTPSVFSRFNSRNLMSKNNLDTILENKSRNHIFSSCHRVCPLKFPPVWWRSKLLLHHCKCVVNYFCIITNTRDVYHQSWVFFFNPSLLTYFRWRCFTLPKSPKTCQCTWLLLLNTQTEETDIPVESKDTVTR
jgi:hypothetical protein